MFDDITVSPAIAALPKADLHVHAETDARLDRVLARRDGRAPYDWRVWARTLVAKTPPGVTRLTALGREYAIAAQLGFSSSELLGFTRNAIRAAFLLEAERGRLLAVIERQSEREGTGAA